MNTKKNEEFDYQEYMKKNAPDPAKIRRGLGALREKRETAKTKITIRIDDDVIQRFKEMVPEGRGYQKLVNQALREWLAAQGVKELLREELTGLVDKAVSSIESATQLPR